MSPRNNGAALPGDAGPLRRPSPLIEVAGDCLERKVVDGAVPAQMGAGLRARQPALVDTAAVSPRRKLINIQELEETYGFKRWTIRTYCSQRRVPFVKIGRRVFFDPAAIEAWIKEHERPVSEVPIP